MIRLLMNSWLPSPKVAWWMQVLLSPGFLWDAWRRESGVGRPLSGSDFVELLLSEVMLLAGLALARYKQQVCLFHQIDASIRLETSLQQISCVGDAAKRLLTVTCDACVSLSKELQILKPSASFLHLLGAEDVEGRSFLDFVDNPARISNFIKGNPEEDTPSNCHVSRLTVNGVAMVVTEIWWHMATAE
eukprot:g23347.t1